MEKAGNSDIIPDEDRLVEIVHRLQPHLEGKRECVGGDGLVQRVNDEGTHYVETIEKRMLRHVSVVDACDVEHPVAEISTLSERERDVRLFRLCFEEQLAV